MQGAALSKQLRGEPVIPVPVGAASRPTLEPPTDRLYLAKGSLVAIILSAGLWIAIIKFIALLRH